MSAVVAGFVAVLVGFTSSVAIVFAAAQALGRDQTLFGRMAARADINFTLDAEEADRLVLSLKLLDRLAREGALGVPLSSVWCQLGLGKVAHGVAQGVDVFTQLEVQAR